MSTPPPDSPPKTDAALSGSPPKAYDVSLRPPERGDLVHQAIGNQGLVARRLAGERRVGEEAEDAQPIVHRHVDDAVAREGRRVVAGQVRAAGDVAAAEDPHHHWRPPRVDRRDHVQRQAVFAHRPGVAAEIGRAGRVDLLQAGRGRLVRRPHARPRRRGHRRFPAQRTDRRRGVANGVEDPRRASLDALHHAALDPHPRPVRWRGGRGLAGEGQGQDPRG